MPYLPRNVGIQFARGKYLAFLDNDDLFTKTALEELTTLAEKYHADVINVPSHFSVSDKNSNTAELLNPSNHYIWYSQLFRGSNALRLQEVKVISQDIAERIKLWLNWEFHWATWALFCRRDFWVTNQICFPFVPVSDDKHAIFSCICLAKKLLSVPNITYIQRERTDSISREKDPPPKFIHKWLSNLSLGFKALEEFMSRVAFFGEHPEYSYAVKEWFFNIGMIDAKYLPAIYAQVHPAALNPLVEKEFQSDDAAFAAYLFNTVNIQRLQIMQLQQELSKR